MDWITCQDIQGETWRRLLEFANLDFTLDRIERFHGAESSKSISQNYKKQAGQIRAAILQSKEYFDAAAHSSLFTSPNHLYYGMVALNTATMLMLSDGTKSLDRLRNDKRNLNHGLEFSTSSTEKSAKTGLDILEKTHVRVCPNGFFKNWYESLPESGNVYALVVRQHEDTAHSKLEAIGGYTIDSFSTLQNHKASLIDVVTCIPEVGRELHRYSFKVPFSRVTPKKFILTEGEVFEWPIHGATSEEALDSILTEFKIPTRFLENISATVSQDNKSAIVRVARQKPSDFDFSFPTSRKDINNEHYVYGVNPGMHEIVEAFCAGFAFSMLSRYYPDIWISCLESHCKASKLTEHMIGILLFKFPMLALSKISGRDITLTTQRPHWYN